MGKNSSTNAVMFAYLCQGFTVVAVITGFPRPEIGITFGDGPISERTIRTIVEWRGKTSLLGKSEKCFIFGTKFNRTVVAGFDSFPFFHEQQ